METKVLTDCSVSFLEETYGLRRNFSPTATLTDWIEKDFPLTELERSFVQHLRNLLTLNVESWHEQDLALHFIGPVFSIVQFTVPYKFNLFSERYIAAVIGNYELKGKPDEFVASGFREPKVPYFAFNEYKREKDPNGDPAGQCLAAMLVGQSLNDKAEEAIFGCYVIGRDWYFMTLLGKEYCISRDYSAVTDDVFDILRILKVLKEIVTARTQ